MLDKSRVQKSCYSHHWCSQVSTNALHQSVFYVRTVIRSLSWKRQVSVRRRWRGIGIPNPSLVFLSMNLMAGSPLKCLRTYILNPYRFIHLLNAFLSLLTVISLCLSPRWTSTMGGASTSDHKRPMITSHCTQCECNAKKSILQDASRVSFHSSSSSHHHRHQHHRHHRHHCWSLLASSLIAFCRRFDFVSNSTKYPSGKNHGTRTSTQKSSILDPQIITKSTSDCTGL